MSADLGHINLAIVRRPSHPPQWHAHPLASHRQPGIHTATLIRSPARIRSPQSVRQLRTSSSHSPFALGLRQPCACHALPSARISQSCSRPRSPTGCEGMRSPAGCSLYFVMAPRYRASPQKSPQASARAPPTLRDPPMGAASPERPPRPRARRRARWPPRARPPCL